MSARVPTHVRLYGALLVVALLVAGLVLVAVDAAHRRAVRATEQHRIDAMATRLPFSDLALSGGSRWLRAPSVEEPNGAFADGPALPDPDPAGGFIAPGHDPARDTARPR